MYIQLNCTLVTIWFYSVAVAPYFIVVSDTHYTSLDQTTVNSLPSCGTVTAPRLNAIVMLDRVCQPHTASRYLYIYQAQAVALQIFEVEVNIIPEKGKNFVHISWHNLGLLIVTTSYVSADWMEYVEYVIS